MYYNHYELITEFRFGIGVRDIPESAAAFRTNPTFFPLGPVSPSLHHLHHPSSFPVLSLLLIKKMAEAKKGKSPKEFAGMLPALSLLFQTAYLPCNQPTSLWEVSLLYVLSSLQPSYLADPTSLGCR